MSSRVFILGSSCLALALGGCSLTPTKSASSGAFTGDQGLVATTLNLLASDASSANGADVCKNVLAAGLVAKLDKLGSCATIIDNQLKTTDDFTLKIKTITVRGAAASARVQTVHYGQKIIQTVRLARGSAGWRVTSAV